MDNGKYRTSDLYVSAWLLSQGLVLEGLGHSNGRRIDFVFEDREDRLGLVKQFISGQAIGNVGDYSHALRKCKNLLYDRQRTGKDEYEESGHP